MTVETEKWNIYVVVSHLLLYVTIKVDALITFKECLLYCCALSSDNEIINDFVVINWVHLESPSFPQTEKREKKVSLSTITQQQHQHALKSLLQRLRCSLPEKIKVFRKKVGFFSRSSNFRLFFFSRLGFYFFQCPLWKIRKLPLPDFTFRNNSFYGKKTSQALCVYTILYADSIIVVGGLPFHGEYKKGTQNQKKKKKPCRKQWRMRIENQINIQLITSILFLL